MPTEPTTALIPPTLIKQIRRWMDAALAEDTSTFVDCNEVQCTQLAEACAEALEHEEWLDDEQHPVWDVAVEVAEKWGNSL